MADAATIYRIQAIVQGYDQVNGLKNAVRQLTSTVSPAALEVAKLRQAANVLGTASTRTENDLRTQISVLRDLRSQVQFLGKDYRDLTRDINVAQRQLEKGNSFSGQGQGKGRLARFGQAAGAVAASGVFGGPEGFVGAGIGAAVGGPAGALAGGAIGAQVGQVRQQLGGTAEYAANLEKQRLALKLVLKDTSDYQSALAFLSKTSKELAIPQKSLIEGFTGLSASVVGAGGNLDDAKTTFIGIASGIRGTGKSLSDLDSALLATAQVFSKGKVTAEELRGQIGERLPGAFTLFAKSINKTPQELDKALERGEVSLSDFLRFSKTLFGEYGENAKIIADSPEAAGDRLTTALGNLSESVGRLLAPIGAAFQTTFAKVAEYIDSAARKLADFLGFNRTAAQKSGNLNNLIIKQRQAIAREEANVKSGVTSKAAGEYAIKEFQGRIVKLQAELGLLKDLDTANKDQQQTRPGLPESSDKPSGSGKTTENKEAEKALRDAETLSNRQQQLDEDLAKQRIAYADRLFEHEIELDRKRYELNQELLDLQQNNYLVGLSATRKEIATAGIELKRSLDALDKRAADANIAVRQAQQVQKSAEQMAAVTAEPANIAAGSSTATGYISKEVLRKWLISQGMSRTSGDFTNAGHKTPNHMLNAMDMGFVGKQYDHNYVQKTIEVERKLRATNAFGNQLFGPERDPKGHGTHLHVPTPGGQVKLNPALAALIGMGGSGAGMASINAGQNSQVRRAVKADGTSMLEGADVTQQQQLQAEIDKSNKLLKPELIEKYYNTITSSARDRIQSLEQENNLSLVRNRLQLEGVRPELIEQEEKLIQLQTERGDKLAQIKQDQEAGIIKPEQYTEGFQRINAEYDEIATKTKAATAAQIAFNDALEKQQKIKDFAGNIASTISGGIGEAFDKLLEGTEDWKKALQDIATNVLRDIAKQLINMVVVEPIKKSIASMLEGVMGGGKQAIPQLASAVPIIPQATYSTTTDSSTSTMLDFNAASSGLNAWSSQLPNLAQSTTQLTDATQATSQAILNTAQGATQASTGFAGLSMNLGKAMAALAGIGVGAAGAQQIGQGGASNFLGGLGKMFVGAGSLLGGFGGGGGFGVDSGGALNPIADSLIASPFAKGGVMTSKGPMPLRSYSKGGIANSPQLAMFGEGKTPEAFVPLPDGRRIPVAMSMAGGGKGGLRDAMGAGPGSYNAGSPMLNMSFETTKFGDTEYVSRDQLESAMAATRRQASRDGARRGMSMTLDKLQQSPGTRSRVGIR